MAKAKTVAVQETSTTVAAPVAAAPVPTIPKDEKNGVVRPSSGKTKTVWEVADQMSQQLKAPVDRKTLTDVLLAKPYELVVGTIHTQYGKWRKYHGLVTVKAEKEPAEPKAKKPTKKELAAAEATNAAPATPEVPAAPVAPVPPIAE